MRAVALKSAGLLAIHRNFLVCLQLTLKLGHERRTCVYGSTGFRRFEMHTHVKFRPFLTCLPVCPKTSSTTARHCPSPSIYARERETLFSAQSCRFNNVGRRFRKEPLRMEKIVAGCKLAKRVLETETPVMVQMQELLRSVKDCMSLAQGVVYWKPPEQAMEKVKTTIFESSTSNYGADEGITELRNALIQKLHRENKLTRSSIMVTAGANQAFVNIVLTLCDPGDSVVMFIPYYFNAYMSFQMTGITNILLGPSDSKTLQPDADWLEEKLSREKNETIPKLVTIVNPGNPSGAYVPDPLLKRISSLCAKAGCWLVVDNTYEYFMYDGLKHTCVEGSHVINIFSFSKAYGMMGWRIGYIAYPSDVEGFGAQLLKVQDNIPICASIIGQRLALYSLEVGTEWVKERVKELAKNRDIIRKSLSPLGEDAVKGGQGAIYLWAKLPSDASDDLKVVEWLAKRHGVGVIPGSASGGPGYIRVSFGGLPEDICALAADRLKRGLQELVTCGMVA